MRKKKLKAIIEGLDRRVDEEMTLRVQAVVRAEQAERARADCWQARQGDVDEWRERLDEARRDVEEAKKGVPCPSCVRMKLADEAQTKLGSRAADQRVRGNEFNVYEGLRLDGTIWSVGVTVEAAVAALCTARGWTQLELQSTFNVDQKVFTWSRAFVTAQAAHRAAGKHVAGGVVCTWWE